MATSSVHAALRAAEAASPTFDGPAVLGLDAPPAGFTLERYDTAVGRGRQDFVRACEGLRTWATHRTLGVRVHPTSTPVRLGGVYVVTLGTPVGAIAAPCRVTRVTDEPAHWGFSYRTLPGHPEVGEEAFDVRLASSDQVRLGIVAVSRHADGVMRLAGPIARLVQRRVTTGYGRSLRGFVREPPV